MSEQRMTRVLQVLLHNQPVGALTRLPGERSVFTFDADYRARDRPPILSQSFITGSGKLLAETRPARIKLPPFFSNLLPEGPLRRYLADTGGVHPEREFELLRLLGEDLPGAVRVTSAPQEPLGEPTPPRYRGGASYRFSLAGVQLKFSALGKARGGLTIPARGIGGDWIVKLPATQFPQVPENEWSMLHLARQVGIPVPDIRLIEMGEVEGLPELGVMSESRALAIQRFDRRASAPGAPLQAIHIEDFAQVYNLYPRDKYRKVSYDNLARMVWLLTGEAGLADYLRRLTFNLLIGNGDMHLKNWSLRYPDGDTPELAPAYDYLSTIPYLPGDKLALTLGGSRDMQTMSLVPFKQLAARAGIPLALTLDCVRKTAERTRQAWIEHQLHYPISAAIRTRIDRHLTAATERLIAG